MIPLYYQPVGPPGIGSVGSSGIGFGGGFGKGFGFGSSHLSLGIFVSFIEN
jgi:hypothetical protein